MASNKSSERMKTLYFTYIARGGVEVLARRGELLLVKEGARDNEKRMFMPIKTIIFIESRKRIYFFSASKSGISVLIVPLIIAVNLS
jgi:predicted subunit of tRNA(5-methylaminomethyl-2-thiouridylate) methyltransferase